MTLMRRPSPFGDMLSLRQAMDRLFEDSFVRPRPWAGVMLEGTSMPLDVYQTKDEVVIEAALPGVKPDEVDITVEGGTLTISGQTESEHTDEKDAYLVQEIRRGSFSRSVTLPTSLEPDKASATFDNGVLTLRIPKAEQVKPRQIRIGTTSNGGATTSRGAGESQTPVRS